MSGMVSIAKQETYNCLSESLVILETWRNISLKLDNLLYAEDLYHFNILMCTTFVDLQHE